MPQSVKSLLGNRFSMYKIKCSVLMLLESIVLAAQVKKEINILMVGLFVNRKALWYRKESDQIINTYLLYI